jgi:hypothetical protein
MNQWLNVVVFPRHDIRRIDVMMVVMGAGIFCFYAVAYDWQTAVLATLTYVLVWMASVWIF